MHRFVYQSDGSPIQMSNFEPELMEVTLEDQENLFVYANVTNGLWSLSDRKIPRHNLCAAECQ